MRFDVIKHHRWWFILSTVLVVASIVSMVTKGFNLGIDYTGGTIIELKFEQPVAVSSVRSEMSKFNLGDSIIQLSGSTEDSKGDDVIIRTKNLEAAQSQAIVKAMTENLGKGNVLRIETVGAVIGAEVTKHALINLFVAFLALALYISYRFEYRVALSSLAAITHDLVMVLGVFSFFN